MMRRMTGGRGKGWGDARKKVMQAQISSCVLPKFPSKCDHIRSMQGKKPV